MPYWRLLGLRAQRAAVGWEYPTLAITCYADSPLAREASAAIATTLVAARKSASAGRGAVTPSAVEIGRAHV